MAKRCFILAVTFLLFPRFATYGATFPTEPLAIAAEYYFSRHDFRQSYQLWNDVLKRQPESVFALLRIGELKLMFEGRSASRDVLLKFLDAPPQKQNSDARREVREKLKSVESTFVSDEGLSLYLQAGSRIKRKDCPGAIGLLDRAAALEAGNLRIYMEKGGCEKTLGVFDRYYETSKLAYADDPYDREVAENLLDGHLYFKQFAKVEEVLLKSPELASTVKGRTALALAFTETGKPAEALPLLQSVMDQQKQAGFHPIVLYVMGRILSERLDASIEATNYLERFLGSASREVLAPADGWDPYHCQERVDETKLTLARLKSS